MMDNASTAAKLQLCRANTEEGLNKNEWRPMYNFEGHWMGKVLVQLGDETSLRALHSAVQGKQIAVGGRSAVLAVDSLYLKLG